MRVPWKVSDSVSERMRFIVRLQEGEQMAMLCREFGISRKTGYKLLARYEEGGPEGLFDRASVPATIPHRTSPETARVIIKARRAHPTWGPRKLRAWLLRKEPGLRLPAPSTIGDLLKREGLVEPRKRRRMVPNHGVGLRQADAPNDVWCADFKGEFSLGNGRICYPLTITDRFSRMILACEALESTSSDPAQLVFERTFRKYGLPKAIRTDNGTPFASRSVLGLSRLSVTWLRRGIWPERIKPAHPEQNGQHERMHRDLKREATRPAARTLLAQQERFDAFVEEYNTERPHEALSQARPVSVYRRSDTVYSEPIPALEYPHDDVVRRVRDGEIRLPGGARIFISTVLDGETLGLRELDDGAWRVSYAGHALGCASADRRFHPGPTLVPLIVL